MNIASISRRVTTICSAPRRPASTSRTTPLDFGIDHDEGHFICRLPIAAPEIIPTGDQYYIAALNTPKLNGIRIAPLTWTEK